MANSQPSGAESGALGAPETLADPDLRAVVEGWPELPEAVRAGIVAMVQAATETGCTEAQASAKRE